MCLQRFIVFFSFLLGVFACDNDAHFNEQPLMVEFSPVPLKKAWRSAHKRIVYYLNKDGKRAFTVEDIARKNMRLFVHKGGILPVLACLVVDMRFSPSIAGSGGCPLASGALYPYHRNDVGTVRLEYGTGAKVARLVFVLQQRGVNIRLLNMQKLFKAVETSSGFIDHNVFLQSLARNKLNRYNIRKRRLFQVQVPKAAQEWIRSWISASHEDFLLMQESVRLPKGVWMFLNPHGADYGLVSVSSNGYVLFSVHTL